MGAPKIIRDKFLKARGGKAKLITIFCTSCGERAFIYQKDGNGPLHRCYVNRFVPEVLAPYPEVLSCSRCKSKLGTMHVHNDGRLAYNMIIGTYVRKNS